MDVAAQRAVAATEGHLIGVAAKKFSRDASGRTAYLASALIDGGSIPVFGYDESWSKLSQIPPSRLASGHISDDCKSLKAPDQSFPVYQGLAIKKNDFLRRLKQLMDRN